MKKLPALRQLITTSLVSLVFVLALPASVFAHVVVTPAEASVGSHTTFSVSVPNEKEVAVTQLRVAVPSGLKEVQPTVKPGWTITTTKNDDGDVTAIVWSEGSIPADQRDDFSFRGQLPAKATALTWKAYQTYADGSTVAWDQTPSAHESDDDSASTGPYSVTNVVDDLADNTAKKTSGNSNLPLAISLVALVLSVSAVLRRRKQ